MLSFTLCHFDKINYDDKTTMVLILFTYFKLFNQINY